MNAELDWNKLSPLTIWRDGLVKSEAQWSESLSSLLKDPKARVRSFMGLRQVRRRV